MPAGTNPQVPVMPQIKLDQPATLAFGPGTRTQGIQTRFFPTAAEAVKFAMESLDGYRRNGAKLFCGDASFRYEEMRALYDSADFPLPKAKTSV